MTIKPFCAKQEKFSLENPKKTLKKVNIKLIIIYIFKYIGQGVPLPPLQKNFIADLDKLNFWDDPPQVVKIHNFFFSNDNLPKKREEALLLLFET